MANLEAQERRAKLPPKYPNFREKYISPAETKNLKFWIFVYIFDFFSQVCLFIVIP